MTQFLPCTRALGHLTAAVKLRVVVTKLRVVATKLRVGAAKLAASN